MKTTNEVMSPRLNKGYMKNKERGASLIEIVAYLGLAGLVIGGALAMFTGASSSQASNQITSDLTGVRTAVRSLWSTSANFGTANMLPTLSAAKRLPTTWATAGTGSAMTATHQLNGAVGVKGQTGTFAITYDGIPSDVCTSVVSQQGNQNWTAVYVGAAAGNSTPLTTGAVTGFDPATVSGSCSGGNKKITLVSG